MKVAMRNVNRITYCISDACYIGSARHLGFNLLFFKWEQGQVTYQLHLKFSRNVTVAICFTVFLTASKLTLFHVNYHF